MFSMAVAGLARSLFAVTISLRSAAARHAHGSTVRPGGTSPAIAARADGGAPPASRGRKLAAAAALAAALLVPGAAAAAAAAPAAQASVSHSAVTSGYSGSWAGNVALDWAERYATGCWYYYGGSSCSPGYDCSGLVMEAFGHAAGIWLPHSTYAMLSNPHLHWIPLSQAQRGDLMFYGSGHVEINTVWYHTTFGAHDWGQQVGWITWGPWWYPTAAYRVW